MLYDFYGVLLTDKQREYMELYYREDYSLGEIADLSNVSRQAIYDNIKRTEQLMEGYETKLGLYGKFVKRQELLTRLEANIRDKKEETYLDIVEELTTIN